MTKGIYTQLSSKTEDPQHNQTFEVLFSNRRMLLTLRNGLKYLNTEERWFLITFNNDVKTALVPVIISRWHYRFFPGRQNAGT
jgi:hypothetical protein